MGPAFWILFAFLFILLVGLSVFFWYLRKRALADLDQHLSDASLCGEVLEKRKKKARVPKWLRISKKVLVVLGDVVLTVLAFLFVLSLLDRVLDNFDLPLQAMVVASPSMAEKNEKNAYLEENGLDDQLQVYDLVFVEKVDDFDDIDLYDIVCYVDGEGKQIIHRVIGFEDEKLVMRGDANQASDPSTVSFAQVVGKYTGVRIPWVGFFIFYLQSDYGIMAVVMIGACLFSYWFFNRGLAEKTQQRADAILLLAKGESRYAVVGKDGTLTVDGEKLSFDEKQKTQENQSTYVLVKDERRELEGDKRYEA